MLVRKNRMRLPAIPVNLNTVGSDMLVWRIMLFFQTYLKGKWAFILGRTGTHLNLWDFGIFRFKWGFKVYADLMIRNLWLNLEHTVSPAVYIHEPNWEDDCPSTWYPAWEKTLVEIFPELWICRRSDLKRTLFFKGSLKRPCSLKGHTLLYTHIKYVLLNFLRKMHKDRPSTTFNSMIYPQQNMLGSLNFFLHSESYSCQKCRSFQSFLFL